MSSALSFCLFEAARHPEMQARMVEEIYSVIDKDGFISMEQVQKLEYVECFIKEVLRLYPTVPLYERRIRENFKLGK